MLRLHVFDLSDEAEYVRWLFWRQLVAARETDTYGGVWHVHHAFYRRWLYRDTAEKMRLHPGQKPVWPLRFTHRWFNIAWPQGAEQWRILPWILELDKCPVYKGE